jgi:hypothetical protein
VIAAVLKTWWDSRVSLLSGLATLLILTAAYVFLKPRNNAKDVAALS